jgi:uncharacterized protein YjiS (DUF1127 family)
MVTIGFIQPRARLKGISLTRFGMSVERAWRTFERLREVWAARRQIRDLDDHILRDLGITRSQALYEVSRPFWDRRMPFEK